jgi:hypothetical protein
VVDQLVQLAEQLADRSLELLQVVVQVHGPVAQQAAGQAEMLAQQLVAGSEMLFMILAREWVTGLVPGGATDDILTY